jgi:hypothetical protein
MAPWAYNPVEMSVTATPTLDGGRSGSPVLQTCGYPSRSEPQSEGLIGILLTCA